MNDIETSRVFSETADAFAKGFRYIINKGDISQFENNCHVTGFAAPEERCAVGLENYLELS